MAILTNSVVYDITIGLGTILFVIFCRWLVAINNFWKDRGIPNVKPTLLVGNFKDLVLGKRSVHEIEKDIYNSLKGERFGGYNLILVPILMIKDPELIEKILVKDFSHFVDRSETFVDVERDPMSAGFALLSGNQWRHMRHKMTPTFTSGKLKGMFEQMYNCSEELLKELSKIAVKGEAIEAKTVLNLFSIDVISSCTFGLQFQKDREEGQTFRKMRDLIFSPSIMQTIRVYLATYSARLGRLIGATNFPTQVGRYFIKLTKDTIAYREKNNVKRNDFLQLLLTLREQEKTGKIININHELIDEDAYLRQDELKHAPVKDNLELTDEVLAAQALLFLTAGSETVTWTTSFTLFSLATNPHVQTRAQEEVDALLNKHGGWTYQAFKDMTYLDQVVQESLRFHPFIVSLSRIVTTPYKIPGTEVLLEKNMRINIPVHALHMDPQIYPNPKIFDPDRFKDNNHRTSWKYLPFGDGPRMCIGMRFALVEMKICLAKILSRYSITLNDRTHNPLQFESLTFLPRVRDGIWLHFHDRLTEKTV